MNNDEILDDLLHDEQPIEYPLADKGIRFVNFFVDRLVMFGLSFVLGIFLALIGKEHLLYALDEGGILMDWIFGVIVGTFYYSLFEYLAGGRSIAKFLTGTKVVSEDGNPITYPQILGRTLSRFVPFEPFSFLGDQPIGWHDSWSGTRVVKTR